jgi:pyruvate dehydrogenase E2 component (dihydrolipoamide acetyltransferase)
MIEEYLMPKLGHLQEVGTVVEWKKQPGEEIRKGEIFIVVETEKTTIEVEATFDGTLLEIVVPVGETVPVNTLIARYKQGD